jgi:eukaryotic-like serine/threonine-protein kinase
LTRPVPAADLVGSAEIGAYRQQSSSRIAGQWAHTCRSFRMFLLPRPHHLPSQDADLATIPQPLLDALADRYRLVRELGVGGMATVYLAEDEKHGRQVAVKVLRSELAASVGQERFLREIAIAAQLQHPHVLPLHDSGQAGDYLFYVMPYVDGPSLRQKLIREGELPIGIAIRILRDIADALAHAHGHGVVHRDIKPENVMLSGRHALVADFGVAKALAHATGATSMTSTGLAVGTPTYMSPEQAAADPHTDHRADIYAFGAVAYELLAGRPPFVAPTPQALLALQLTASPEPLSAHRASVPGPLEAMVMQCLAKRPADRVQSADELVQTLETLLTSAAGLTPAGTAPHYYGSSPGESPRAASRRKRYLVLAVLVPVVAVVAVASMWLWNRAPAFDALARLSPTQVTYDGGIRDADLSPDGELLAYCSTAGDSAYASVRDLGGGSSIRIAATGLSTEYCNVRWSPDGSSLLVQGSDSVQGLVMIFPRLGGAARHTIRGRGWVAWAPDGRRIARWGVPAHSPLRILELATGDEQLGTIPDSLGFRDAGDWSPSGEYLVVGTNRPGPPNRSGLHTLRLSDGRVTTLLEDSIRELDRPRWSASGEQIYYVRAGDVWTLGVRADGTPRGRPQLLRSGLQATAASLSSDEQRLAYLVHHGESNIRIVNAAGLRADGDAGIEITRGSAWHEGTASPDGSTIAFLASTARGGDLFVAPASGGTPQQLTSHHEAHSAPAWSPDGTQLAYIGITQGGQRLRMLRLSDRTERTFADTRPGASGPSWAPGARILYQRAGNRNYHIVDPATGVEEPLVSNDSVGWMFYARYSPDGKYVSVTWNREQPGLWLIDLRDGAQRRLPSARSVRSAGWSSDGQWVYMLDLRTNESYRVAADGSGDPQPFRMPSRQRYSWCEAFHAAAGLSFLCYVNKSTSDVWLLDARADRTR